LSLPLIVLFAGLAIGVFAALVSKNYVAVLPLVLLGLALVLVAIPYAIYVSFLDRFGARALVLEQLAARPSIVRAHRLLRKRLGRSLLVWLISIGVSIALGSGRTDGAGAAGMTDELDRIAPRESARNKARDKKVRGPKVVSVNPGLKKLAQHLAEKRTRKKSR